MGSHFQKSGSSQQLADNSYTQHRVNPTLAFTQIEEPSSSFCCVPRSRSSQKFAWRRNFELNCQEIRGDFKWVDQVYEAYKTRKQTRPEYVKQIDEIKCEYCREMRDSIAKFPTEEDIRKKDELDEMIKRSVIIPNELTSSKESSARLQPKMSKGKEVLIAPKQSIRISTAGKKVSVRKTKVALMSFVDEKISSLFGQKQLGVDQATANALRLFVHFTEIVQRHSNSTGCILYTIKSAFTKYLQKEYGSLEQVTQQTIKTLNSDIKQFIRLYKQTICDYYRVVALQQLSLNHQLFNQQNILNAVTAIVFKAQNVYEVTFETYKKFNQKKQKQLDKILLTKQLIRPEDLEIKEMYCLNKRTVDWYVEKLSVESGLENITISAIIEYEPYQRCIEKLRQLTETKTPIGKMKVIMRCAEMITCCICEFYRLNGIETKMSLMDADQVLTIFSYIVMKSQIKNLLSHLDIIQTFSNEDQQMGATGYYYSVILSSVENLYLQAHNNLSEMTFGPHSQ